MTQSTVDPRLRSSIVAENHTRVTKTADATLGFAENIVDAVIPAAGSITLTLPPVASSRGKLFAIKCLTGAGDSVIVQDQNDSELGEDLTRTLLAGQILYLFNPSGQQWIELVPGINGSLQVAEVTLADADTGGGILSWPNPEGVAIVVENLMLDITTKTSAACTIDGGVTVVSATTSDDGLINGLDANAATGLFSASNAPVGITDVRLAAGGWVTVSKATGAAAGLVGKALIVYRRLA